MNKSTILLIFIFTSFSLFSQRKQYKSQESDIQNKETFLSYKSKGDANYFAGDYGKALSYYTYCKTKIDYLYKEDLNPLIDKSKKLYDLSVDVTKAFLQKDFPAAQKYCQTILSINPVDSYTKKLLVDIKSLIRMRTDNFLDIFLKNAGESTRKGELEKAKAFCRIIINNSETEDYKKTLAIVKIKQINEIESKLNRARSVASTPIKSKEILSNLEIKYPDLMPFISEKIEEIDDNKREFDKLSVQGRNEYNNGNYSEAIKTLKRANRIPGYEGKLKVIIETCGKIIDKIIQIEDWRSDPSKNDDIDRNYKEIAELNKKDTITIKKNYVRHKEKFDRAIRSVDCSRILSEGEKLYNINSNKSDRDGIRNKMQECQNILSCNENKNRIKTRINVLKSSFDKANTLNEFKNLRDDLVSLKGECNSITCWTKTEKSCSEIEDKIEAIEERIKQADCFEMATSALSFADSLFLGKMCEDAIKAYDRVEEGCLSEEKKKYLIKQKREAVGCFINQQYTMFLDSASQAHVKSLFRDELRLYSLAKKNTNDSIKRAKIEILIAEHNCLHFQKGCNEIENLRNPCSDTTKKILALEFYGGINWEDSKISLNLTKPLEMNAVFVQSYSFGTRLQKVNLKKVIGHRFGFVGSYQQFTIPFQRIDNYYFDDKFSLLTTDFNYDIKFQTKPRCSEDSRFYLSVGFLLGKSFPFGLDLHNKFSNEVTNSINSIHGGLTVALGFERKVGQENIKEANNKNKGRMMFEFFYQNRGNILDVNKKLTNPINSSFTGSMFGFKIGYLFTLKKQ